MKPIGDLFDGRLKWKMVFKPPPWFAMCHYNGKGGFLFHCFWCVFCMSDAHFPPHHHHHHHHHHDLHHHLLLQHHYLRFHLHHLIIINKTSTISQNVFQGLQSGLQVRNSKNCLGPKRRNHFCLKKMHHFQSLSCRCQGTLRFLLRQGNSHKAKKPQPDWRLGRLHGRRQLRQPPRGTKRQGRWLMGEETRGLEMEPKKLKKSMTRDG